MGSGWAFTITDSGCRCSAPGHLGGECPDGCLCEPCACSCTAMCSVGGRIDQRFGGCGCGCPIHTKS